MKKKRTKPGDAKTKLIKELIVNEYDILVEHKNVYKLPKQLKLF